MFNATTSAKSSYRDFFQLSRRAEFGGHDVQGAICEFGDLVVGLAGAGSFQQYQIEIRRLQKIQNRP